MKRCLRVLFLPADNNTRSGAFLSMVQLCKELKLEGIKCGVILPKYGDGSKLLAQNEISYKTIPNYDWVVSKYSKFTSRYKARKYFQTIWNLFSTVRLITYVVMHRYDIIHVNTSYSYIGMWASYITRRPVVWHIREFLEEDQNRMIWCKNYGYKTINNADAIVVVSRSVFDKYQHFFDISRMHLIYNGIDVNTYYKATKIPFSSNVPIFLFVGQLNESKGCFTFIDACVLLSNKGYNFKIWFIGKENDKFNDYLQKSGISDKANCFGYQSNTDYFYEKCDVSFVCSRLEAFGRVAVESMMAGNLVIGANSGCTKEIIRHGENGLLYKVGDADSLSRTIEYAINHKEEMRILASNSRDDALKLYTSKVNSMNISNLYGSIMSNKKHKYSSIWFIPILCVNPICYIVENICIIIKLYYTTTYNVINDFKKIGIKEAIVKNYKYLISMLKKG